MWFESVEIANFRGIERLSLPLNKRANVIVGPNAIGKTTLLEAMRVAKAVLAPRIAEETNQAFISLGAISPHYPTRLNFPALAGDPTRQIQIVATTKLSEDEIAGLDVLVPQLAQMTVQASLGQQAQSPLGLVQFLSSGAGQNALKQASDAVVAGLQNIKSSKSIVLDLTIDPTRGIRGARQLDQLVFAAMEGNQPPQQSLFSYFPADRALPPGEVAIQIGGPDVQAQLTSHNSQPQQKFQRLKPTIVNNFILSSESRDALREDFKAIFSKVLKNKELVGINVNELGLVSIGIKEASKSRSIDIDGLSSGEKGLILTFLLISRTIARGGVVMIDEPELHLNPAVCKTILPFLVEEYLQPKDVQAIICSHSPEILGSAFDSPDCLLLHLQSPTVISKIYPGDRQEVFEALRRLGTTASDVLFFAGSIYVEGPHDLEILESGFSDTVIRYQISHLGGRDQVEREIKTLQAAEKKDEVDTLKCFIFDLDGAPTSLQSTRMVKVLQWKRRCLENYLIDEKAIYDLLSDGEISTGRIAQRGKVREIFEELALSQLNEVVAQVVYVRYDFENPGLRPKEIAGKSFGEMATILFDRLGTIQTQTSVLGRDAWQADFVSKCTEENAKRREEWKANWIALCDGKRFMRDLHAKYGVKISPQKFKKMIIERMERDQSDGWAALQLLLTDALRVSPTTGAES